MKIIALADTHSQPLPKALIEQIKAADLLVHAGDFADVEVYHRLQALKELRGVYGNVDGPELREILPRALVFECEGVRIGVAHGDGHYEGIMERLQAVFAGQKLDLVVFGHSHMPQHELIDGVTYFNPGSPTDMIRAPYLSYGLIDVHDGKFKARIVKLK
jgi:uncharacterized protein